MPFVKPSLSHRRSTSSSPTISRIRKTSSGSTPKSSPLNSSSQSILQSSIHSSNSDLALAAFFTPSVPASRRRSHRSEENADAPRKRRKRNPETAEEITRETPILRQPSSSGTDFSKSCASSASSSTSGGDRGEAEIDVMEEINMEYHTVSEAEKEEIHVAVDDLVGQELITATQGDAIKEIFETTFDQRRLYDDWLTTDPKTRSYEDEGVGTEEDEEEKKTKSLSPKPTPKSIPVSKIKEVLLQLRDGVGKFSLRWREARDKKADPTIHHRTHRSPTYRSLLLHRDSNHCVITHIRDSLIAAHILPFTIASLARSHRFWSFMRMMLGPTICDKLFARYGSKPSSKRLGNTGINSPENGWILRSNMDEAFGRMECYLEPVADEPNKYTFNWLQEPDDLPSFSRTHTDEGKRRKPLETGTVIDLTPIESPLSQKSSSQNAFTPQAPSRALITIQAAIHKLAHKFRGQADIFDTYEDSDGSEAASSIGDDDGEQEDTQQDDPAELAPAASPSQYSNDKVTEWLRSVSPVEQPETSGIKRKRSDLEDEDDEETVIADHKSPTILEERPTKRTKTTHTPAPAPPPSQPSTTRRSSNRRSKSRSARDLKFAAAAAAVNEAGLLSPVCTNKSETSPEDSARTRRYNLRECNKALTYEPTVVTPKTTPAPGPAMSPVTPATISAGRIQKRNHTAMESGTRALGSGKSRVQGGVTASRKRRRLSSP
ncbi:hypothetical protein ABW19_dt0202235 [Dactylella cylindrospora]|nr:hypothetical protein ABW19_dt0202235 [Dactylella cylindrospora]